MRRFTVPLVALLILALVGTFVFWRTGMGVSSPSTNSTPRATTIPISQSNPPPALKSAAMGGGLAAAGVAVAGWPGNKHQYLGRYKMTGSSNLSFAHAGELTIFLRKLAPNPIMVLSGILTLNSDDGTNVFYLTHFEHNGAGSMATRINLGVYTGPVLGRVVVTGYHPGVIVAKTVLLDGTTTTLHFMRFSRNPHP